MLTSPLPPATILGTWTESLELTSVDDDTYVDLSGATEIVLSLIPDSVGIDLLAELTLSLSTGQVTLPALGIIQWRAERTQMSALVVGLYKVVLTIDINGDTFVLILGSISIVG